MKRTIFERYGGLARISRIVSAMYDKILDSPLTAPYFEGVDMRRLIDHQTRFVATLMGGPASYTNEQLERAHARLGITEPAFAEMVALLGKTLEEFGFADEDIAEVERQMLDRKHLIVARSMAW